MPRRKPDPEAQLLESCVEAFRRYTQATTPPDAAAMRRVSIYLTQRFIEPHEQKSATPFMHRTEKEVRNV